MRNPPLLVRVRGTCLAVLSGAIVLRPLSAAEINPQIAALVDFILIGAAWLTLLVAGPRRLAPLRSLRGPLGLWGIALILGMALHRAPPESLGDRLALAGGPLLLCASATSWGPWRARVLEGVWLIAIAISAFALWQALIILPALAVRPSAGPGAPMSVLVQEVAARGRVLGSFALPILLAAYCSLVIPTVLNALSRARAGRWAARVVLGVVLLLTATAWILTRSIGSLCSMAAACAIVWLRRGLPHRWIVLGSMVLLVCGSLILSARRDLWNYSNPHHPVHNRLVYWDAALHLITTHPIRGVGPGQFASAYRQVTMAPDLHVRHAHNTYLQVWAEWGLFAFVAWCWLLIAILRQTASLSPWLAVAIWVLPLSNLVDFSFYIPQVSMLWWYLAGWSLRHGVKSSHYT